MSLKLKITLAASFAYLLIIVLLGYIFFIMMNASLQKEVELEAQQVCNEASYAIEEKLYSDIYILKAVMARSDIFSSNASINFKVKTVQEIIRLFEYEYVLLIWNGDYYKIKKDSFVKGPPLEGSSFSADRETVSYGRLYETEDEGLLVAEPALTNNQGVQYQMVLKRKADWIWEDLTASNTLRGKNIVVSTPEGEVLFPNRFAEMKMTDPVPEPTMSWITLGGAQSRQDRYAYIMPMENVPLYITSYIDQQDVRNELQEHELNFIMLAGCSVAMIAVLIFFLSQYMTRAIAGLAEFVEKTDRPGDVPEVFTKRRDEAGVLARAFSSLMQRLESTLEEKEYIAFHDKLTELPNRYVMEQDITELLLEGNPFAFGLLDIDNFKSVNDQLGHMQGDLLLFKIADLLQRCGAQRLKTYRWGGDEFGMVLYGETEEEYRRTLDDILREVAAGFGEFEPARVSVSIGVCVYPKDADTQTTLLQNADNALTKAKQRGKKRYCFYKAKTV